MTSRFAPAPTDRRLLATGGQARGLEQTIRYSYSAAVTNLNQRLMVVPRLAHGPQRRRRWSLLVSGVATSSVNVGNDVFGNLTLDITVPVVEAWVEFTVRADMTTASIVAAPPVRPDDRYLRPTRLTTPTPSVVELAATIDPADPGAICSRVHRSIGYEWGRTGVRTTASEALAGGRGVCQDYAHIMLAVCRRAGVPARYVSGHLVGEGGSHAWVEVLRPHPRRPGGWIAEGWDPTHDRRTNADYLTVAVGRDYADVTPMWGTYRGPGVTGTLAVRKRLVRL